MSFEINLDRKLLASDDMFTDSNSATASLLFGDLESTSSTISSSPSDIQHSGLLPLLSSLSSPASIFTADDDGGALDDPYGILPSTSGDAIIVDATRGKLDTAPVVSMPAVTSVTTIDTTPVAVHPTSSGDRKRVLQRSDSGDDGDIEEDMRDLLLDSTADSDETGTATRATSATTPTPKKAGRPRKQQPSPAEKAAAAREAEALTKQPRSKRTKLAKPTSSSASAQTSATTFAQPLKVRTCSCAALCACSELKYACCARRWHSKRRATIQSDYERWYVTRTANSRSLTSDGHLHRKTTVKTNL
jgi:hypothetical protein